MEKCLNLEKKMNKEILEANQEMRLLREDLEKSRKYYAQAESSLRESNRSKDTLMKQVEASNLDLQKTLGDVESWKKKCIELENRSCFNEQLEFKIKILTNEVEVWKKKFNQAEIECIQKNSIFNEKVKKKNFFLNFLILFFKFKVKRTRNN